MAKIMLRNGREVLINALPLGEAGDEVADLLAQLSDAPPLRERRELYKRFGIAAVKLFNPDIPDKTILDGLDMGNIDMIIQGINGFVPRSFSDDE